MSQSPLAPLNSAQTVVPTRAYLYLAPVGTAAPADATAEMASPWKLVGHTTPDSLSFGVEPEFQQIDSHQSDQPIRRFTTGETTSVSVDLLQWNGANFKAVYGGGTITTVGEGSSTYKFVPPSNARDEVSAVVEVVDGSKRYRWVYVKCMQVEGVTQELQKGQGSSLPLRLSVLGSDSGAPWYMLTNDPAFAPA